MTPVQLAVAKKAMALQDQVKETALKLQQKYVEVSTDLVCCRVSLALEVLWIIPTPQGQQKNIDALLPELQAILNKAISAAKQQAEAEMMQVIGDVRMNLE
ncbi:MAG TPA: hypothetical protein PLJ88_08600 [Agitococcus sp.]|nr:hypothetical protein [Agitococcus sp.]